jgi:hypothetical protein
MGAEVYIYLNLASTVSSPASTYQRAGSRTEAELAFDMKKCHFFDAATAKSSSRQGADERREPPDHYWGKRVLRAVGAILITACALMAVLGNDGVGGRTPRPDVRTVLGWCFCCC